MQMHINPIPSYQLSYQSLSSDLNFSKEGEQSAGQQQQNIDDEIILEDREEEGEEEEEEEEEDSMQLLIADEQLKLLIEEEQQERQAESIEERDGGKSEEIVVIEDEEEPMLITETDEQRQQAERIDLVIEEVVAHRQVEEQEPEGRRSMEIEIIEDDEEPLRKITKWVIGHKKEYYYLETVKSIEELDRIRYTVMLCNTNK
jgi:hypothetical protein